MRKEGGPHELDTLYCLGNRHCLWDTVCYFGHRRGSWRDSQPWGDCVLLLSGPISMIAATAVAWRHEPIGGWWLIAGGVITGILFAIRLIGRPMDLLWTFLVYPLPMLVAGVLRVLHEAKPAKAAK